MMMTTTTHMIPGTRPVAKPAGRPPPNHFLVAEKIDLWIPFLAMTWGNNWLV